MIRAFILDVSACIPWCCEDETTSASEQVLDWALQGSELHVPALWVWEVINVLAVMVKRQRITSDRAREFLTELSMLNLQVATPPSAEDWPRLQRLADLHQLTSYDAAYLDLALQLALPLATRDEDLRRAALAERIELIES